MARARFRGGEYELLNLTDRAEFVLRDDENEVTVTEGSVREPVEIRCERCGRFSVHVALSPAGGAWVCHDRECWRAD